MAIKKSFRFIRGIIRCIVPRMETVWETEYDGEPCVFCPNHDRAWGPLAMLARFEHCDNIDVWYNFGIGDRKGLPAYVRNDNWWNPKSPLAPFYNVTVPYIVSWLLPPIVRTVPGVPVYYDTRVMKTFRDSTRLLKSGRSLVIFPQFPDGYESHAAELSKGFLMIAPLAWKSCGLRLKFYPVHVDRAKRQILVQKPVQFDPDRTLPEQEAELLEVLTKGIWD